MRCNLCGSLFDKAGTCINGHSEQEQREDKLKWENRRLKNEVKGLAKSNRELKKQLKAAKAKPKPAPDAAPKAKPKPKPKAKRKS